MKRIPIKLESGLSGKLLPNVWQKWLEVTCAYSKSLENKEGVWWYRERTWIGFIAAAVWKLDGVALEEFSAEKIGRKHGKGRVDLYFRLAGENFIAEAKHVRLGKYQRRQGLTKFCQEGLRRAEEDVKGIATGDRRLALLFISPWVGAEDSEKERDLLALLGRLTEAQSIINFQAMAWTFPDWARKQEWLNENEVKGLYSPGGILLAREIGR
jgi:hypothetical protein